MKIKSENLKKTIVLVQYRWGGTCTWDADAINEDDPDYVVVSQAMPVTFQPLDADVILESRVKRIDKKIEETRAELTRQIASLTDEKNRLLCITQESEERK